MTHIQITRKYFVTALLVTFTQASPSIDHSFLLSRVTRDNSRKENFTSSDIIINYYKITLNITSNGHNLIFNGVSETNINVKKPTNSVTLHVGKIEIKPDIDIKCHQQTGLAISTLEPLFNDTTKILKIIFTEDLLVGSNCNLTIAYDGKDGWYSQSTVEYESSDGKKTWMTGLIESEAYFPYLYGINYYMNYAVSIGHSRDSVALSSMEVVREDVDPGNPDWITTHFAQTPKIWYIMIAFVFGDFIKTNHSNNELRVWDWDNCTILTDYIQDVSPKIMKALDDYTDLPLKKQGLKKLDIVMMDHLPTERGIASWGLIILNIGQCDESENSSTTTIMEDITRLTAHEISHEWFGSLFHINDYMHLWLLEGFAQYLEYVITDKIEPTWRLKDKFVTETMQSDAFSQDAKSKSLPLAWNAEHTENLNVYAKAASVIRMISYVIGEDRFITELRNFIKKKAFEITTSEEFFDELVKVCPENKNLPKILNNWITTRGYPVINVKRDYEAEKAIITQSRFLKGINEVSNEKYWVAINYVTDDNLNFNDTNVTHWFDPSVHSIEIDQLKEHQFIILNKQQFGYYRVNYDERNWELIINYLTNEDHSRIHVLNRAQLIDDAFNLAKVGHLQYKVLLSLLGYLKQETDFIPWSVAWRVIEHIYSEVINTEVEEAFKHYVLKLSNKLEHTVLYVEVDNITDHIIDQKRHDALKWTCLLGSKLCTSQALKIFTELIQNPQNYTVPKRDVQQVICAGLAHTDGKMPEELWNKFYTTIIKCPLNMKILNKCLSRNILQNPTFWQFFDHYFDIIHNMNNMTLALDYIIENYNTIMTIDGYSHEDFEHAVSLLGDLLTKKVQLDKLKTFIEANVASFEYGYQILADVDNNLKKVNIKVQVFKEFFKIPSVPE